MASLAHREAGGMLSVTLDGRPGTKTSEILHHARPPRTRSKAGPRWQVSVAVRPVAAIIDKGRVDDFWLAMTAATYRQCRVRRGSLYICSMQAHFFVGLWIVNKTHHS